MPGEDELLVALDGAVLTVMAFIAILMVHDDFVGTTDACIDTDGIASMVVREHPLREAVSIQPGVEHFVDGGRDAALDHDPAGRDACRGNRSGLGAARLCLCHCFLLLR